MKTIYGETPNQALQDLKKYYYGSIIDCLYRFEDNYEFLDQRLQSLINQIHGSLGVFNNNARVLSIIACLEDARINKQQFRKDILDAANMVDELGGQP